MKVTVYKVTCTKAYCVHELGTRWALAPWGKDTSVYEGYDEGGEHRELPDGYSYAESTFGSMELYGPDNMRTQLVTHRDQPAVVTPEGGYIILKKGE